MDLCLGFWSRHDCRPLCRLLRVRGLFLHPDPQTVLEHQLSDDALYPNQCPRVDEDIPLDTDTSKNWTYKKPRDPDPRADNCAFTTGFDVREESIDSKWSCKASDDFEGEKEGKCNEFLVEVGKEAPKEMTLARDFHWVEFLSLFYQLSCLK